MANHKSYNVETYFYEIIRGSKIEIHNDLRKFYILDSNGQPLKSVKYSKSIDSDISVEELFEKNREVGDYTYGIFVNENGYDIWLYRGEIAMIL